MARHRQHGSSGDTDDTDSDDDVGGGGHGGLRIDKWLWCTRFFKSRGLAHEAVEGGHVQVNGDRVKASRQVKAGDRLLVTRERERFEVDVLSIPARRGPATEARTHYRETPESEAARTHVRELNKWSGPPASTGRPDKRERRNLMRLARGQGSVSDDGDEE